MQTSSKMRLDQYYRMVAHIYGEQNAQRSPSATFAHFVEVCGMLTIHDRKKKREAFDIDIALCKALGWFFPLMAKFRVRSVESLIFRKYPYACPYCRQAPHIDQKCKTVRGTESTVDHRALREAYTQNIHRLPHSLDSWQQMFSDIYPRNVEDKARSTIGLFEELGELAEAIRVFDRYPKYFAGEAADVFSYLMGIANEHALRAEQNDDRRFSLDDMMMRAFPGLCVQCGSQVCVCPSIPEATVGRMSKELDVGSEGELFGFDYAEAQTSGRHACDQALSYVGGYAALAQSIPLDRGDANKAVVTLCVELASTLRGKAPGLADSLEAAALRISRDATTPGTRKHNELPQEHVALLREAMRAVGSSFTPGAATSENRLPEQIGNLFRTTRILLATASPRGEGAISVDTEARTVSESLERSKDREHVQLKVIPAATSDSVRRALLEQQYDIVHLAGHADHFGPIFEDGSGFGAQASLDAIANLISRHPTIRCVILNSCLSLAAWESAFCNHVIGMNEAVDDNAAIAFSKGFYDALGAGHPIDFAVAEGENTVQLAGHKVPLKVLRKT